MYMIMNYVYFSEKPTSVGFFSFLCRPGEKFG